MDTLIDVDPRWANISDNRPASGCPIRLANECRIFDSIAIPNILLPAHWSECGKVKAVLTAENGGIGYQKSTNANQTSRFSICPTISAHSNGRLP